MASLFSRFDVVGFDPPTWSLKYSAITIRQIGPQTYTLHRDGKDQPLSRPTGAPLVLRSLLKASEAAIQQSERSL